MKILSGVYTRDSGSLEIFGKEYGDLTPKQAQEAGVAIIHQELNMCKHLSVAENMFLGREKTKGIVLANGDMEAEASRILNDLKIDIDPKQVVGELPVSKQQMVEIAKALSVNARILIMDEPTSALTAKEIDDLFRIIKDLRSPIWISSSALIFHPFTVSGENVTEIPCFSNFALPFCWSIKSSLSPLTAVIVSVLNSVTEFSVSDISADFASEALLLLLFCPSVLLSVP